MNSERRVLQTLKAHDGHQILVVENESVQEFTADDVASVQVGGTVSKLSFTRTAPNPVDENGKVDTSVETRVITFRLVIPTHVLAQTCRNLLGQLAGNQDGIARAFDFNKANFLSAVKDVEK
jgi:hypothetical protein